VAGRQVVVVGDINVCHKEIDAADAARRARQAGLSSFMAREDRQWCGRNDRFCLGAWQFNSS